MITAHLVSGPASLARSSTEPIALAPSMIEAVSRAHAFAPAATPIIVHGESGTGKTFFAEYIHQLSGRAGGFHGFSIGTVAPQLAVDELFGHVPGAYTDARKVRAGRITTAENGTLLLDDIQNLDTGIQKQLLQVLDRGRYSPVGSDLILIIGCRIILAMTEDPDLLMSKGVLLKDLRYRFGSCSIRIPPLRERRAEIAPLAERALLRCPIVTQLDGPTRLSEAAMARLGDAEYGGNVRQLEGGILVAFLLARQTDSRQVDVEHLPPELGGELRYHRHGDALTNCIVAERAVKRTGGNVRAAARLLGVSRNALSAVLKKHAQKPEKTSIE